MSRIRTLVAVAAIALPIPAVAGCGGSSSNSEDPQQVLDQTFNNPQKVTSGNVALSVQGTAQGSQSGNFSATISGPFQGDANDPTAFPQLDLNAKINASGAGQSFSFDGSLITTNDNAYVVYQDQAYEVGTTVFQQFKQAYERAAAQQQSQKQTTGSIFKRFGVDPKTWLTNVSNEGETDVGGTTTIHIHGDADVSKIVSDFVKIAQQTPGGATQAPSQAQLQQVEAAIKDATVDVYSGADDHLLRKLAFALTVAPPASAGQPVSSLDLTFSIEVSDVNQPQTISAPQGAKPISGLLQKLGVGSLGPLGGLGGSSAPALPGAGGASGTGPSQAYLKCVQQASPSQINQCASKLQ